MAEKLKPRKLFVPIDIRAISGNHVLLKNKQVPVIGYITDKKRYNKGGCVVPREVCFHYGTMHPDFFYFEDYTLTYMAVSIKTPLYLTDVYVECIRKKEITIEQFVEKVVTVFVLSEMGFIEKYYNF